MNGSSSSGTVVVQATKRQAVKVANCPESCMMWVPGRPGALLVLRAMTTFKFVWNGIKVNAGKLQKARYMGNYTPASGLTAGTITIYARDYRFSREVWETFDVVNDSDIMTDYFEKDVIRVKPDHPLYAQVLKACKACDEHYVKMQARREARYAQRRQAAIA